MTSPEQGSEHGLERNLAGVFQSWWNRLNDVAKDGAGKDRAALARLRRITMARDDTPDVLAALNEPAFRQLCVVVDRVWGLHELADDRVERLLTVAVTLAQIKQDAPGQSTAGLLGGKDDPDRAMKEGRFLAFMRAESPAELFEQARRLPALLKGKAPVGELGASLLLWTSRPAIRRNWARQYYHLDLRGRENRAPEYQSPSEPEQTGA